MVSKLSHGEAPHASPVYMRELWGLTPRHLFRQLEPSWFLNGQTTSLLASEAENELVKADFGGMAWRRDLPIASRGCLQPSAGIKVS